MKIIFSHVKYPEPNSKSWVELGALSNYFIKQFGYESIFWGDEESLKEFGNIEYNYFERIDKNEINQFPKCLWSMGKLIALSKMKEPCVHIDMDLFIQKPSFDKEKLNHEILCLHDEKFSNNNMFRLQELFNHKKPEEAQGEIVSYNCGVIGGTDISSFQTAINIVFDYVTNQFNFIEEIYNRYKNNKDVKYYFYPPVLVEQVWLFQILKTHLSKQIHSIIDSNHSNWNYLRENLKRNGIIHLMHQKSQEIVIQSVNRKVQLLNLKF